MKIRSLQTRIIVFFGLLTIGMQLVGLLLLETVGVSNARNTINEQLVVGERVFNELMKQRASLLAQSARVLSADYAFREALASRDNETIVSALENHGARIHAEVMMLIDLDGRIVADTSSSGTPGGRAFAWPTLISATKKEGTASAIVVLDTHLVQVVVMPVAAPLALGWVVTGFAIDDAVASDLHRITGMDVTFLSRESTGRWTMHATTVPPILRGPLTSSLPDTHSSYSGSLMLAGDEYATRITQQSLSGGTEVDAVLQRSLEQALVPFRKLMQHFAGLALIGIFVSILFSVVIARGIAWPVRQLASFARRIAGGDYSDAPKIERIDEIGDLSTAFEHMREGIASREAHIMDLAYRDGLTGLPNRALFTDRLQQAIAQARRSELKVSILSFDLDRFKYVNDTLGHHLGDALLQVVAGRLKRAMRRETDTVARFGSDEFAILLPTTDLDAARKVASGILRQIEVPASLENHLVDVQASIGIACFPDHGDDLKSLMRHADVAMYVAKRENTGFGVYDGRYDEHKAARLSLMSELRQAVDKDELVVFYQPKVALATRSMPCVEALIRWQHPQRGFVPPGDFIPFAEQTGYIRTITMWLLEHVVMQMGHWQAEGLDIAVSINISARDLLNPDLPTRCAALLADHGCRAELICFELTESAILEDATHAVENLDRLAALGCKLSIDDYGTGYSSLSYLKQLPVDELKIDRSFIMNMMSNHNDRVIVQSTIDLAHNMRLSVTAEGVEDHATLDRLRAMGCDMAQGYLMSRPISAEDITRWMKESDWAVSKEPPLRLLSRG